MTGIDHQEARWSQPVTEGWTVSPTAGPVTEAISSAGPIPAVVPGTIHTDLMAAGLIPDPYQDRNEAALTWIGECDWTWATRLPPIPSLAERVDLVFDGVDTVATVRLDGHDVLRTANQHRSYRVDVTEQLREGDQQLLEVEISSPVRYADAQSLALGYRPQVNQHPYPAIRKMACNFGWDWGPDLATAGLWRPVYLEGWSVARLAQVRAWAEPPGEGERIGRVRVAVDVERADSGRDVPLAVTLEAAGTRTVLQLPIGVESAELTVDVPEPKLWWPTGYGEPALYAVHVQLHADGVQPTLDTWSKRLGFRTVELDTRRDEVGHAFTFVINGRRIFVKGANWIPDDAFPHRVDEARYRRRVTQAAAAGVNLLRVWGGGIFESDFFYDACDEAGILTWQDFLFACAAYAEEDPLRSEVEAEVRQNVTRLMTHPSLVLWNGSNENYVGYEEWGWPARLDGRTWGRGYYEELLPRLVAELDGSRPYTPSSPWSVGEGILTSSPDDGSMHLWETWNRLGWEHYRDNVPRFAAEWGWQAPPAWHTLRSALHDDPLTPESPGMLTHQKAMQGNDKLTDGLVPHLRLPQNMRDWHWAMQLNQAWALTAGITHHRSSAPRCAGTVVWQLNDMWPVVSWSVIDGDGRVKPAYWAMSHAFAPRLVTVQPVAGGGLEVRVVNDTDEVLSGELRLRRLSYGGEELATAAVLVEVAARTVAQVPVPVHVSDSGDPSREFLEARLDVLGDHWFFAEPRDSGLAEPNLAVCVEATDSGWVARVQAKNLARDLTLLVDQVDPAAEVDDGMLTVLPGQEVTFHVRGSCVPAVEDVRRALRCTNDLVVEL